MNFRSVGLVTLCLVFASQTNAESFGVPADEKLCQKPLIEHLDRPLYPGEQGSPRFQLAYAKVVDSPSSKEPVIIYVPGGPGGNAIGACDLLKKDVPRGKNVYFYDPRGAGRSKPEDQGLGVQDRFFLSRNAASDLVALVQELGLKNYIIRGHSYGTAVATMAAYELERLGNPPAKVILSGTMGRARGALPADKLLEKWQRTKSHLPEGVLKTLSGSSLPFGFNEFQWGGYLAGELVFADPGKLAAKLATAFTDPTAKVKLIEELSHQSSKPRPKQDFTKDRRARMNRVILCSEFGRSHDFDWFLGTPRFVGGALTFSSPENMCEGYPLSAMYDPKSYPLTSPIVYFQGSEDVNTPALGAQYHFKSQTHSTRVMITVPGQHHDVLSDEFGRKCGATVMNAAVWATKAGLIDAVRAAVSSCSVTASVRGEIGLAGKFQLPLPEDASETSVSDLAQ